MTPYLATLDHYGINSSGCAVCVVCVGVICVCMHTEAEVNKMPFSRQGLSLKLELNNSARLAGQDV